MTIISQIVIFLTEAFKEQLYSTTTNWFGKYRGVLIIAIVVCM